MVCSHLVAFGNTALPAALARGGRFPLGKEKSKQKKRPFFFRVVRGERLLVCSHLVAFGNTALPAALACGGRFPLGKEKASEKETAEPSAALCAAEDSQFTLPSRGNTALPAALARGGALFCGGRLSIYREEAARR